jgi:hypothetical protein
VKELPGAMPRCANSVFVGINTLYLPINLFASSADEGSTAFALDHSSIAGQTHI